MDKWLLTVLLVVCVLTGCIKSNDSLQQSKAQAIIDDNIIKNYIAANHLNATKIDTSGVYYIILQPGAGNDLYTSSTQVTVGDTGRLLTTQKVFYKTNDFHPSYSLGQMIIGWRLGIPKIKTGGIVRLLIPSRDGYGHYAQPIDSLPANAVLDFNIKVYTVTN